MPLRGGRVSVCPTQSAPYASWRQLDRGRVLLGASTRCLCSVAVLLYRCPMMSSAECRISTVTVVESHRQMALKGAEDG